MVELNRQQNVVIDKSGFPYKKLDLHVHTPKSACYSDMAVTADEIVEAALADGLDAIAITDHNTAAGIEEIRQAALKQRLCIFPGIELSTVGGHIIILFSPDTPVDEMEGLLDYLEVEPGGRGDAIVQARGDTVEVLKKIAERGALAIAAHVERWPSGFLESNLPRRVKREIHNSEYLAALEITIPQNKVLWNTGKMRGYTKPYACVQGSDAHAPEEIGRRPVYIRMPEMTLYALRTALEDYKSEIAFPGELCHRDRILT